MEMMKLHVFYMDLTVVSVSSNEVRITEPRLEGDLGEVVSLEQSHISLLGYHREVIFFVYVQKKCLADFSLKQQKISLFLNA